MFKATLSLAYPARECVEYEGLNGQTHVIADDLDIVASGDLADRLNKTVGEDLRRTVNDKNLYLRLRDALVNAVSVLQGSNPKLFRQIMDAHDRISSGR